VGRNDIPPNHGFAGCHPAPRLQKGIHMTLDFKITAFLFCGLGLKVGNDGDFGIVFKGKRPQNTPFLLSNGAF